MFYKLLSDEVGYVLLNCGQCTTYHWQNLPQRSPNQSRCPSLNAANDSHYIRVMDTSLSYLCSGCGRLFPAPGPLNFHRRSCRPTKRKLTCALAKTKELLETRKRLKLHFEDLPQAGHESFVTAYPPMTPSIANLASSVNNTTACGIADAQKPSSSNLCFDQGGASPRSINSVRGEAGLP